MTRRYFHPELPLGGGLIQLDNGEAQHAARVMRVSIGDTIILFDGIGNEAEAKVSSVNRRQVCCQCGPATELDRESSISLSLGIALPKPDRAKEMVERLTELGVASVTPIIGDRTQRPPSTSLIEKLRRSVIESCKQCGRNRLMVVHDPGSLAEFLSGGLFSSNRWIAHPSGAAPVSPRKDLNESVVALIGPEGGWSEEEVAQAISHGFQSVSLGKRILRIETAAAVIAALVMD
tara:strand:- start:209681 stop:210382 length:702 start_codon:yes stop_codon:yes gene_type:complete